MINLVTKLSGEPRSLRFRSSSASTVSVKIKNLKNQEH